MSVPANADVKLSTIDRHPGERRQQFYRLDGMS